MLGEIEIYAAMIIKHRVAIDSRGCADPSGAAPHTDSVVEGMWPNVPFHAPSEHVGLAFLERMTG